MQSNPLPKIDDIFANLANCKYFCSIDLSGAYQQLKISETPKKYVTMNTHKGLYQYTRLPQSSIFQSVMDQILFGVKNITCYLDDILKSGSTFSECKKTLYEVLTRRNDFKVKINVEKCFFFPKNN